MKVKLYTSQHEPEALIGRYIQREYLDWELSDSGPEAPSESFGLLVVDLDLSDGLQQAAECRKRDPSCQIIFIASSDAQAIDCFRLHPAAYLLKPLQEPEMTAALDWCVRWLGGYRTLGVTVDRVRTQVRLRDIVYLESRGGDCFLHTQNQSRRFRGSLTKLSELQTTGGFLRCHNSYLINLNYVERISENTFTMTGGDQIPLSPMREDEMASVYDAWKHKVSL